jgi:hypothetical protein
MSNKFRVSELLITITGFTGVAGVRFPGSKLRNLTFELRNLTYEIFFKIEKSNVRDLKKKSTHRHLLVNIFFQNSINSSEQMDLKACILSSFVSSFIFSKLVT